MKQKKVHKKFWFILTTVTSCVYIIWRLFFTLPLDAGIISLIAGLALFIAEFLSHLEAIIHMRCMSREKDIKLPIIPNEMYPDVDILIATHSEEVALLEKTINGCCHMEYPNREKIHIYLCDDANRPEMAELAKKMGVGYFGLEENKYAKAGNLNNALEKTHSPLVATFDSDMIPRREFLMRTVPYFFLPKMIEEDGVWRVRTEEEIDEDYKIGFIQTPQNFYNPDLFQFNFFGENNIPNEQDYFFRDVNVGRNSSNAAIYAGSNTLISRAALEEVGYIRTGTITEDFATGIDIQSKGYTTYAIDEVLASGLAPADFVTLLKQRQRWGRGCVQVIRSLKFWTNKLPLTAKLSYLCCLFYWWTFFRRFIYILSPIIYVLFNVLVVRCSLLELAFLWLPTYLIYNHTLKIMSGKIRNQRWSNIVDTIICPYMIIPIFLETIGIRLRKFVVSRKEKINAKNTHFRYAIPHLILLIATLPCICKCIYEMILYRSLGSIVVFFWLLMNGYFLLFAVFFMMGRINYRSVERYYVKIPVEFELKNRRIQTNTLDISENGFLFSLEFPEFLSPNKSYDFEFEDRGIKSTMPGKVVHVDQRGDVWKYSIKLDVKSEHDKLEYFQIVYDRTPSLATEIKTNAFNEIRNYVSKKVSKDRPANRKLPRIYLNQEIKDGEGKTIQLIDFNYQYATIDGLDGDGRTEIVLSDKLNITVEASGLKNRKDNLYRIVDWESVSEKMELREYISQNMEG